MDFIFDNDALWFLAATQMIEEALEALETAPELCARLPTSVFMLNGKRTRKKLEEQYAAVDWTQEEIIERIATIPALDAAGTDQAVIDTLSTYNGLDPGEVTIFALVGNSDVQAVTGDLRAVEGLSTALDDLPELAGYFDHRIVTLLCVIDLLRCHLGIDEVQRRCREAGVQHRTAKAVLGSRFDAPPGSVKEGIAAYRRSETERASFPLWWPPEE